MIDKKFSDFQTWFIKKNGLRFPVNKGRFGTKFDKLI